MEFPPGAKARVIEFRRPELGLRFFSNSCRNARTYPDLRGVSRDNLVYRVGDRVQAAIMVCSMKFLHAERNGIEEVDTSTPSSMLRLSPRLICTPFRSSNR